MKNRYVKPRLNSICLPLASEVTPAVSFRISVAYLRSLIILVSFIFPSLGCLGFAPFDGGLEKFIRVKGACLALALRIFVPVPIKDCPEVRGVFVALGIYVIA